uniref:Uncharacterized protein n=1 Tax=Arundo donax TaxID=35708 RepID=A0A0A9HBB6_ARUDO
MAAGRRGTGFLLDLHFKRNCFENPIKVLWKLEERNEIVKLL